MVMPSVSSCRTIAERHACAEAELVAPYLRTQGEYSVGLSVGIYKGGAAVVGTLDEAFWVKDGVVHVVNEAAHRVAPNLPWAPPEILPEEVFRAAKHTLPSE